MTTASLNISGDQHSKIMSNADTNTAYFKKIRNYLNQIKELNSLTHETIYTFRVTKDKRLIWTVMLHEDHFVGEEYIPSEENRETIEQVIHGAYKKSRAYQDENGYWISSYAPIFSSQGKVVGILEADYKLNEFLSEVNNKFLVIFLVAGSASMAGIIIMVIISRRIVKPIKLLTKASKRIKDGKYDLQLKIDTKDEINELAGSFNEMSISFGRAILYAQIYFRAYQNDDPEES